MFLCHTSTKQCYNRVTNKFTILHVVLPFNSLYLFPQYISAFSVIFRHFNSLQTSHRGKALVCEGPTVRPTSSPLPPPCCPPPYNPKPPHLPLTQVRGLRAEGRRPAGTVRAGPSCCSQRRWPGCCRPATAWHRSRSAPLPPPSRPQGQAQTCMCRSTPGGGRCNTA